MKKLLGVLLLFAAFSANAQEVDTFTFSNPYPFSECTYQVTTYVEVVDNRGSLAVPLEPVSTVIHPGSKEFVLIEIPKGKSFFSVSFSVEAHGSGVIHQELGNSFEAREHGCLMSKDAHTFWNPIGNNIYQIWEALVTSTTYTKE